MRKALLILLMLMPVWALAQFCGPFHYVAPISLTGVSNQTITLDSISSIKLTNCTNITIFKCKVEGSTGVAISLSGCTNITIDSTFVENVQQGIIAQNCTNTQILSNYIHNVFGAPNQTYHPIQFITCTRGHINYNKILEDPATTQYTHDQISIYNSNGVVGDSIQVIGNWIRGGQQTMNGTGPGGFTGGNNGACGINLTDSGGAYQVARGNLVINGGYIGMQVDGRGSSAKMDHNKVYSSKTNITNVGISYYTTGSPPGSSSIYIGYNNINWTQNTGGIFNKWFNPSLTQPQGWATNTATNTADPLATSTMIPTPMVTACSASPVLLPPVITYTSPNTFQVGTAYTLPPFNSGGAAASWSGTVPPGMTLNTSTGVITGTPTTNAAATNYVITAHNTAGTGSFTISITIGPRVPIISYPSPDVYVVGNTVNLSPTNTGGAATAYTITGKPAGTTFSATTGVLSGTVTTVQAATNYTVTATNSSGSATYVINITVNPVPVTPPAISYVSPQNLTVGTAVNLVPSNTGGAVTSTYTVAPALVPGLSIDPTTGIISGTPTAPSASANFVITASNAGGTSHFTMAISVSYAVPIISYTPSSNTYVAGTTIGALTPSNSGGVVTSSYTVAPALPLGITINATTGVISGTPTTVTAAVVYVITASNSSGVSHFSLTITINPAPVALPAFSYSPASGIYTIPTSISPLSPVSTGGPIVSFSITPALPAGLSMSTVTGVITGTVSAVSPLTSYTITGTNASGSGHATVQITVLPNPIIAPNISYSPNNISAVYGTNIVPVVPVNTGSAATFSISPSLPAGMSFLSTTGQISGKSGVISPSTVYTITAVNASGSSAATVTISVAQATLQIIAINQSKYVGFANPALTFGVDQAQLLNGDPPATALQTPPTLSTTATTASPVGTYPITT